jgi:hypothetical protein
MKTKRTKSEIGEMKGDGNENGRVYSQVRCTNVGGQTVNVVRARRGGVQGGDRITR